MADDRTRWTDRTGVFDLLTNETRVGIVAELAARLGDDRDGRDLSFSELRRRVEGRETGNFSYHLEPLEGTLVERTERGTYRLTERGAYLASVLAAGFYEEHELRTVAKEVGPCPECDEPLECRHENGLLRIACANDHAAAQILMPRSQLERRSADELVTAATAVAHYHTSLVRRGVCPLCHGTTEGTLEEGPAERPHVTYRCRHCGVAGFGAPGVFLLDHPAVVAFLHEHGIDAREIPPWSPLLADGGSVDSTVVSRDPPRLRCRVRLEGDELQLGFDVAAGRTRLEGPAGESAGDDGGGNGG
ncbi:ArsR family transcriptional regulator [Halobiforma lacisalsi AJ5]|uniref:ArsR family transcriptional regulator n=1 Tax=Natronobacterium lacisalsi AJ5 TaxID=358396 RepID=M0L4E7_NATLA|nr:helix-turn-helix domain-containing protein [Halobiforma lacisalsi]APW98355.1 ArsR family transcriptional regulator [Halobiforma lacisalsi AJ5]EMA27958.1 putative ArsR family transcriptional regulator [Halobiforma lacisalsi AJ5]